MRLREIFACSKEATDILKTAKGYEQQTDLDYSSKSKKEYLKQTENDHLNLNDLMSRSSELLDLVQVKNRDCIL